MSKLKNLAISFSHVILFALVVKILIIEISVADSIALAVLSGLHGYLTYLRRFQPYDLNEETKKDLLEVKTALSKLTLAKSIEKLDKKQYF